MEQNPNTKNTTPRLHMDRVWAMPNKWTFTIKPVKEMLRRLEQDWTGWADPFAGMHSPCEFRNDLREGMNTTHNMDALDFLKTFPSNSLRGVLYDPPYSITQAKQCYDSAGVKNLSGSMKWWADLKNEIARVVKPYGIVVCFGWNSMGIGKSRGFEMLEVLLIPHGGSKNDTIVTVERKL